MKKHDQNKLLEAKTFKLINKIISKKMKIGAS